MPSTGSGCGGARRGSHGGAACSRAPRAAAAFAAWSSTAPVPPSTRLRSWGRAVRPRRRADHRAWESGRARHQRPRRDRRPDRCTRGSRARRRQRRGVRPDARATDVLETAEQLAAREAKLAERSPGGSEAAAPRSPPWPILTSASGSRGTRRRLPPDHQHPGAPSRGLGISRGLTRVRARRQRGTGGAGRRPSRPLRRLRRLHADERRRRGPRRDRSCLRRVGGARHPDLYARQRLCPDGERFEPIWAKMAELDRAIWVHPSRSSAWADYPTAQRSKYERWWVFGWEYARPSSWGGWSFRACSSDTRRSSS